MKSNGHHRFQLRDDVPCPKALNYPFAEMKPGQSFRIPDDVKVASVRVAASQFVRRRGKRMRFKICREVDGKAYGCWRLK